MRALSAVFTAAGFMSLALLAAGGTAPAQSPQPNGELLFRQRCQACHSVTPARPNKLGPDLRGVVGRKAAAGAFKYSPALKKSGLTWTEANLDKFLAAPTKMVPGTQMVVVLPDPSQRRALTDYLAKQR